jgi:hypothetical protein
MANLLLKKIIHSTYLFNNPYFNFRIFFKRHVDIRYNYRDKKEIKKQN